MGVLAFGAADLDRMREALSAGCATPETGSGLVSALAWLDYSQVAPWIEKLSEARLSVHRAIGIAAYAVLRVDPGPALDRALSDSDAVLSARALRAVGEIKRSDLLDDVSAHLKDSHEGTRFWAAWTLGLYRDRQGLAALRQFAESGNAWSERAARLCFRAMPQPESRALLSALAKAPHLQRVTIVAAGAIGDPATIPWLIKKMETPDIARVAGEAFSMITGADLAHLDLVQEQPDTENDEIDDVQSLDYDTNLPLSSPELVEQWWGDHHQDFTPGQRYLCGRPISLGSAMEVLSQGTQRQRAAAAIEIALIDDRRPLFEVRERADRQLRRLATWIS